MLGTGIFRVVSRVGYRECRIRRGGRLEVFTDMSSLFGRFTLLPAFDQSFLHLFIGTFVSAIAGAWLLYVRLLLNPLFFIDPCFSSLSTPLAPCVPSLPVSHRHLC